MKDRVLGVGELELVRWFLYVSFIICSLWLVATLSTDQDWLPALVGTLVYGPPAILVYLKRAEREDQLEAVDRANKRRGAGKWDIADDDSTQDR